MEISALRGCSSPMVIHPNDALAITIFKTCAPYCLQRKNNIKSGLPRAVAYWRNALFGAQDCPKTSALIMSKYTKFVGAVKNSLLKCLLHLEIPV